MQVRFTDNLGDDLFSALQLDQRRIKSARFAIAFIKRSGLDKMKSSLEESLSTGGNVEFIVGLDFRTTDPYSLVELLRLAKTGDLKFFCFSDPAVDNSPVFHPKLYLLKYSDGSNRVAIGSSNLSLGGLAKNVEVNAVFENLAGKELGEIEKSYLRIRQQENLFVPDEEYITGYRDVYKRIQKDTKRAFLDQSVQADLERLRVRQTILPSTTPTQIDLIIEAIGNCPKDTEGYVRLSDMQEYIRRRATELKLQWDMGTLENSIRGRLNTHSIDKGGMDLFERRKGEGRYKLAAKGKKRRTFGFKSA